jgi:phosphatidylglycerol:prolipoprotein diacylglycerol transferase
VRSTLLYLPHAIGPLPLFGWGWISLLVLLGLVIRGVWWSAVAKRSWAALVSELPSWGMALAAVIWVAPWLETRLPDDTPLGIPIRGYGLMLMLGAVCGVALSIRLGRRLGLMPDDILSLGMWLLVSGIGGARLFYVIQKWPQMVGATPAETLLNAFRFTEGGLVVFGGVLAGMLAMVGWAWRRGVPVLSVADLAAPGFCVGLALGRIGCLLNGCCYGGLCEPPLPCIRFPMGSPAYMDQLQALGAGGEPGLLGVALDASLAQQPPRVSQVQAGSWGAQVGLEPGQRLSSQRFGLLGPDPVNPAGPPQVWVELQANGWPISSLDPSSPPLPERSLPVHPTQLYSAFDAALLAVVLVSLWPLVGGQGWVFATGLGLHGVSRFLLECLRDDEGGQFGTWLTISQWLSLVGIAISVTLLVVLRRRRAGEVTS